jgi:hypothetical protein
MAIETIFKLFRKKGFSETLEILNSFPEKAAAQTTFFKTLKKWDSYPNTFFRVRTDLLKHKLIGYRLNDENEKVIFLTKKGINILDRLQQIENIL